MNIEELRRRRNKAVNALNKSYNTRQSTAHRAYKNRLLAKAAHGHNSAAHARKRTENLKKQNNKNFMNLRRQAQKLGIALRVNTWYGVRNKTIRELEANIARRRA